MHTRVRWLALAILAFPVVPPSAVSAQYVLAPGARVRITAPALDVRKQEGALAWVRGDSLRVGTRTFAIADANEIEVGRRVSNFPLFAGLGLVAGAAVAAVLCQLDCREDDSDISKGGFMLLATGAGAAAGLGAGIIVGAATHRTKWRPVTGEALRITFAPAPSGGMSLGLTVRR